MGNNPATQSIDHSCLNMWRGVIAMAHADGGVCPLERRYIEEKLGKLRLTPEMRGILQHDFNTAPDIEDALMHIEKYDAPRLIFFASNLMRVDGHVDAREQKLLDLYRERLFSQPAPDSDTFRRFKPGKYAFASMSPNTQDSRGYRDIVGFAADFLAIIAFILSFFVSVLS
ncbi:MAG: hypothetical protein R3E13_10610 [Alphaproteobacteria bacterium]